MVQTNRDKLVTQSITGEITHPKQKRSPYKVSPDGEPQVLPGTGGVVFDQRVGDSAVDLVVDHVEPGASFSHLASGAKRGDGENYAFNTLACVGNEAELLKSHEDEDEEYGDGTVIGTHGGVEHVMIDFPEDTLSDLKVGDQVQIKARGLGLELTNYKDVVTMNMDPDFADTLIDADGDSLTVPVTHRIPAKVMGSGLGADNTNRGDYDIQMFDEQIVDEYDLDTLRFGDIVAIENADHEHGRIYRSGAMTIGVVVHSKSIIAGHGPGVTTLLTSSEDQTINPVLSDPTEANLASLLDLRDDEAIT